MPKGERATAEGPLKRATVEEPSALPGAPAVPASVVTTPADETFRMTWFDPSAT